MQFLYPNGATPLDPDEAAGLLPSHISLQADLNDWEKTNISQGVDWTQISVKLRVLLDNTRYWIDHKVYEIDEAVVRFHHQLVWIHPFPNGNGRQARMMADHLMVRLGRPRLSWGSSSIDTISSTRARYLEALRAADQFDYKYLIKFARS